MYFMQKLPRIIFVGCHRKPERSFFYKGRQFPVCARCTGMLLGYLSFPLFLLNLIHIPFYLAFVLNLPAYVDGMTQALDYRESNNTLRLITGLLSGFGQTAILSFIGKKIGFFIIHLIKGGL